MEVEITFVVWTSIELLCGITLVPFLQYLPGFTLNQSGYKYISMQNAMIWLMYPYTIPILIFMTFLLGCFILYELSFLMLYYYHEHLHSRFPEILWQSQLSIMPAVKPKKHLDIDHVSIVSIFIYDKFTFMNTFSRVYSIY